MAVRGTVVRVSNVKPLVTEMHFVCGKCRADHHQRFTDGVVSPAALTARQIRRAHAMQVRLPQ